MDNIQVKVVRSIEICLFFLKIHMKGIPSSLELIHQPFLMDLRLLVV